MTLTWSMQHTWQKWFRRLIGEHELLKNWCLCLFLGSLYSCAQQLLPSGGKDDLDAPKLVKATPPNGITNFNSSTITLKFDEYITLKDLHRQLLISPPLKYQPQITTSGKSIRIKIKDTLQKNTTYRIYLGSAISDIHEDNRTENFTYVFSTGDKIDSLSITGKVVNAYNNQPAEGVNIQVYEANTDSIALKDPPRYLAKTNKEGFYTLHGLAAGEYRVVALKDLNNDLVFQPSTDQVGFLDNVLKVGVDATNSPLNVGEIKIFEELPEKVFVKKINNNIFGKVEIIFNRWLNEPKFEIIYPSQVELTKFAHFSSTNDTLTVFYNADFGDSLAIVFNAENFRDTLQLRLKKNRNEARNQIIKPVLQINVSGSKDGLIYPGRPIVLGSYFPIVRWFNKEIRIISANDTQMVSCLLLPNGQVELKGFIPGPKQEFEIFILPQTFTDILGTSNDSIKIFLKTPDPQQTGSLKFLASSKTVGKFLVELFNAKQQTVARFSLVANQVETLNYLPAENYSIKVIKDLNGNDRWDTGSFKNKQQPEEILIKSDIQVKKRFETELKLEF